jgi:hypothetical protein
MKKSTQLIYYKDLHKMVSIMPAVMPAMLPAMLLPTMISSYNNAMPMNTPIFNPIKVLTNVPAESWTNDLTPKVYNPPPYGICKVIYIPSEVSIGKMIGKNGSVFNAITNNTPGVMYMWFNNTNNSIEIWGSTLYGLEQASKKIVDRMGRVK